MSLKGTIQQFQTHMAGLKRTFVSTSAPYSWSLGPFFYTPVTL